MIQAFLFNGLYECMLVGALFLVVHMLIGNIVEPRMMGHRLGCRRWWSFYRYSSGDGCSAR
jgi:predicted PurR-regulated permease PerM